MLEMLYVNVGRTCGFTQKNEQLSPERGGAAKLSDLKSFLAEPDLLFSEQAGSIFTWKNGENTGEILLRNSRHSSYIASAPSVTSLLPRDFMS